MVSFDEHIFNSLDEYMFTTENITCIQENNSMMHEKKFLSAKQDVSLRNLCSKKGDNKDIVKNINAVNTSEDNLFYPKHNDKLFWCFYIFLHGKVDYDYVTHVFEVEKKFKIEAATKLRDMKAMLRTHKLKYTDIEKELVNSPKITIKGLHALCILYKVSITYISGNIYYILGSTNEEASYKHCLVIAHMSQNSSTSHTVSNLRIGANLSASDMYIKNICEAKIRIKNYNKPMLSIASYTLPLLQEMASILNINIYSNNGKKKLKKELYQEVSEKII